MQRHRPVSISFGEPQDTELGAADANRILQHGLEHGLQLAGRGRDDLQHLRGRGLLLQRLGEIVGAPAQLVEQPRVLDGDDGLVSEAADQFNLAVSEWPHLLAVDDEGPHELVLLEHGDGDDRPRTAELGDLRGSGASCAIEIIGFGLDVGDLNRPLGDRGASERGARPGPKYGVAPALLGKRPRRAVQRDHAKGDRPRI